jgi:hypothetical protein
VYEAHSVRTSLHCPFRIRCNFNTKTGVAIVTTLEDVHTCSSRTNPGIPSIKRAETCKLKFLLEVVPQLLTVDRTTSTKAIIDAVKSRYGQEIAMRQAQKVKATLLPKPIDSCTLCGGAGHARDDCSHDRRTSFQQDDSMVDTDQNDVTVMEDVQGHIHLPLPTASTSRPTPSNHQRPPIRTSAPPIERSHAAIDPSLINNSMAYSLPQISTAMEQQVQYASQAPVNDHGPVVIARSPTPPQLPLSPSPPPSSTLPQSQLQPQLQQGVAGLSHPAVSVTEDVRTRASRMMLQAAHYMQEAARLNAEAAHLLANT